MDLNRNTLLKLLKEGELDLIYLKDVTQEILSLNLPDLSFKFIISGSYAAYLSDQDTSYNDIDIFFYDKSFIRPPNLDKIEFIHKPYWRDYFQYDIEDEYLTFASLIIHLFDIDSCRFVCIQEEDKWNLYTCSTGLRYMEEKVNYIDKYNSRSVKVHARIEYKKSKGQRFIVENPDHFPMIGSTIYNRSTKLVEHIIYDRRDMGYFLREQHGIDIPINPKYNKYQYTSDYLYLSTLHNYNYQIENMNISDLMNVYKYAVSVIEGYEDTVLALMVNTLNKNEIIEYCKDFIKNEINEGTFNVDEDPSTYLCNNQSILHIASPKESIFNYYGTIYPVQYKGKIFFIKLDSNNIVSCSRVESNIQSYKDKNYLLRNIYVLFKANDARDFLKTMIKSDSMIRYTKYRYLDNFNSYGLYSKDLDELLRSISKMEKGDIQYIEKLRKFKERGYFYHEKYVNSDKLSRANAFCLQLIENDSLMKLARYHLSDKYDMFTKEENQILKEFLSFNEDDLEIIRHIELYIQDEYIHYFNQLLNLSNNEIINIITNYYGNDF